MSPYETEIAERPVSTAPVVADPPLPKLKKKRRRRVPFLLLAAVFGAALVGGVVWWLQARQWESTDDAFIDVHMVMIAPQVAGRVSRVLVDDNQKVAAGQLLVELDPAIFQAQLDQAAANREA